MSRDISDRQQRLAEQLRANLRRRKGQARERAEGGENSASSPVESPADTPG